MGNVLKKMFLWSHASMYGVSVSFSLLKKIVTEGYGKVKNPVPRQKPSCLEDTKYGTHGFLQFDDIKIHYVASGPEEKPLMLFVHGFPEFWFSWRHQLVEFSKDYRCVAIDLRGYGESDKPIGYENYQMKYLMKDLQRVIDGLGYSSCILVAHDWGGDVAWSFARLYPNYVDKMINLCCPTAPVMKELFTKDKDQRSRSWYMFFFQLPYLPEFWMSSKDFELFDDLRKSLTQSLTEEESDAYKYQFSQEGAITSPLNFYRALFRCGRDHYDHAYTMPVLLVWGMADEHLSNKIPDMVEKAAESVSVERIDNCGHFVHYEAPDKVNEVIRKWLESQS